VFIDELRDAAARPQNAILVALDLVKRTVEVLAIFPETGDNEPRNQQQDEQPFEF